MSEQSQYDSYRCGPAKPDSAERIVRDLTIGKTTESNAIRRINKLTELTTLVHPTSTSDVEFAECEFRMSVEFGGIKKYIEYNGDMPESMFDAVTDAIRELACS